MLSSYGGAFELRTPREGPEVRLTTTLRVAAGAEMRSTVTPLRAGPSRVVLAEIRPALFARPPARKKYRGDDGVRFLTVAGESTKQAEKTTACGTPDVSGAFVVANSCACFYRA
jgi:hypothetical protein